MSRPTAKKKKSEITDSKIIEEIAGLIEIGASIQYADDTGTEDEMGIIPKGWSIRIRACESLDFVGDSLREVVKMAIEFDWSAEKL